MEIKSIRYEIYGKMLILYNELYRSLKISLECKIVANNSKTYIDDSIRSTYRGSRYNITLLKNKIS